ncbi:MAG: TetR/AcrR family transcriptional regulator [Acidobacteriaceae bacterium]
MRQVPGTPRTPTAEAPPPAQRDIDPRITRSRQVILEATLRELAAAGYGAFAVESVAARAGVGKSTIYRHWRDKLALIEDALATLHDSEAPDISTGSPRERLERILRHVAHILSDSLFSACLPAMIEAAERDERLRRFHHEFQAAARQPLVDLLTEGRATGDFPAPIDPELTALALLGALFFHRLMTPSAFPPDKVSQLIDTVLG